MKWTEHLEAVGAVILEWHIGHAYLLVARQPQHCPEKAN